MGKFVQTTFSLPAEEQCELLSIAEDSHVSTAWVVWEAVRLYLAERFHFCRNLLVRNMT